MSDQASDLGSNDGGQQGPQQDYVQVEGMDSMKVKVTNIVDGFFRFYSARSGTSSSGMSDSGRSSGRSSPASQPASAASSGTPGAGADASSGTGPSSIFRPLSSTTPTNNSTTDPVRPKPGRRASSKKVKFKEDHHPPPPPPPPPPPSPPSSPSNKKSSTSTSASFFSAFTGFVGGDDNDTDTPDTNDSSSRVLDADAEAAKLYMDESAWGIPDESSSTRRRGGGSGGGGMDSSRRGGSGSNDGSSKNNSSPSSMSSSSRRRRRRDRNNMDRSMGRSSRRRRARGGDMDSSVSSKGSWNVNIEGGGEAPLNRTVTSSFEAAGVAGPINFTSLESRAKAEEDENKEPMWFEQYMPNWIIALRAFCGSVVMDDRFQILMVILITTNALCMGVATFDFVEDNPSVANLFERIDFVFLCIFTVELALQFGYWGYQVFTDGWLCFDFVTVVTSWVFQDSGVQVFRSFRVFRAFRLVVRIPILKSLVYAVLHVMPRISSIMGLFALLTYIYAVMATTLYKDYYSLGYTDLDYFGRLDYSLFTLFQFVTLENWAEIVRQVAAIDYFANIIFSSFLTISGFILYSLVVAVVCDSFLMVEAQIRKELQEEAKAARERRKLLKRRKAGKGDEDDKEGGKGGDDETNVGDMSTAFDSDGSLCAMDDSDLELEELDRQMAVSKNRLLDHRRAAEPRRLPPPQRYDHRDRERYDREIATNNEDYYQHYNHHSDHPAYAKDTVFTTNVKTLAVGDLQRRKEDAEQKPRKRRPMKHRIKRVQKRLDKLSAAQTEILATLDSMTREMERRTGISESAGGGGAPSSSPRPRSHSPPNSSRRRVMADDSQLSGNKRRNLAGAGAPGGGARRISSKSNLNLPPPSARRSLVDPSPGEDKPDWIEKSFLKRTEIDIDITGMPNPYMAPEDKPYQIEKHRHHHHHHHHDDHRGSS